MNQGNPMLKQELEDCEQESRIMQEETILLAGQIVPFRSVESRSGQPGSSDLPGVSE
jgi:hypothetical protein